MERFSCIVVLSLLLASPLFPQTTGAYDHALSGSSVMWFTRPGAIFLNPAELGQIRQGMFGFNSHRVSTLSSFSGAYFVPFVGTFAAGVANYGPIHHYTAAYGTSWRGFSFGGGFSGFRNSEESFGFSMGASWRTGSTVPMSGFSSGISVMNLSDKTSSPFFSANFGAAYWALPELLRAQASYRHTGLRNDGLVALEIVPLPMLAIQIGTRGFKESAVGASLLLSFASLDISASKMGMVLSVNASLSEPAPAARDRSYEQGLQALDENRYFEAQRWFERAHQYDPLFAAAKAAADSAGEALKIERARVEARAEILYENKNYVEASRLYARILQMDPDNEDARKMVRLMQSRLSAYFQQLIVTGDSLRSKRETERARRAYQQALDLDPGNDSIMTRIANLKDLAQDNTRVMLNRAAVYLERNQLDEAEREYERVLANDPRNTRARQGLATVRSKRNDELVERGKELFAGSRLIEALRVFLQVLDRDPRHREASDLLDRTRQALKPEVETFFRLGLQWYTKENYKNAIEEWDRGLMIDPNHQGTVEYRKRAEEKLKALERLK